MSRRSDLRLPIVLPAMPEQRYSCHGCGNCCRDFTVQLQTEDLARLRGQRWEERLGQSVTVDFRGTTYLRQGDDGACVFLMENGLCRVHAEFGFEEKPIACQLFPFSIVPGERDAALGVNFACASVQDSKGADLASHRREVLRMVERIPESVAAPAPVALGPSLRASEAELAALERGLERWVAQREVPLPIRLDGLAWFAQSMIAARLDSVRGERFVELVETLLGALPDELALLPTAPPSRRQRKLLRQAVFARTEDPKIPVLAAAGRLRTTLRQFRTSRRFASGRGFVPRVAGDWPSDVRFAARESVAPLGASTECAAIDELLSRWLRATILGRRAWGAGHYGWTVPLGLGAFALNAACVGWLARLHAAGRGADEVSRADAAAALGRVDRMSGRAPWLGSGAEALRVRWLALDDGLRRLLRGESSGYD